MAHTGRLGVDKRHRDITAKHGPYCANQTMRALRAIYRHATIVDQLRAKLDDYKDGDYLLCIGNPVLIGWAVALAADSNGGRVTCLQWSGTNQEYVPVHGTLWDED